MNSDTAQNPFPTSAANGASSSSSSGSGTDSGGKVHRMAQAAHEAVDKLEQSLGAGSEKVLNLHQEYGDLAREQIKANPLAVVAGAFAAGFILAKIFR
jgi:ElaB/YqjD/DUF883 family membrane-anchored ribosome-binding protein